MATVMFDRQGSQYEVRFAYDPTLVDLVKCLPYQDRKWNAGTKSWVLTVPGARKFAARLTDMGHTVVGIDPSASTTPTPQSDWARTLFARVGPTRHDAVFRALTRVLHPDVPATGDVVLQRELIAAREAIRA